MNLDTFLRATPVTPASKPINLLPQGGRITDKDEPLLATERVKPDAERFFTGEDSQRKIALDVAGSFTPPLVQVAEGLNGAVAGGPAYNIDKPAMALLDTFAPDITDLARTGLPLSGFDIPDEKAIREQLRKILRRL